jgi:hypothetical protein
MLLPKPSPFENKVAFSKSKKHKSPSSGQIPRELTHAEDEVVRSELFVIWTNCLNSLLQHGDKADCSKYPAILFSILLSSKLH